MDDVDRLLQLRAEYRKLGCCAICSLWAALDDLDPGWTARDGCPHLCLEIISRYRRGRGAVPPLRSPPRGTPLCEETKLSQNGVPKPQAGPAEQPVVQGDHAIPVTGVGPGQLEPNAIWRRGPRPAKTAR